VTLQKFDAPATPLFADPKATDLTDLPQLPRCARDVHGPASGSPPQQLLHPERALEQKGDPLFADLVFVL
jgi:hypothetical protein